ncbi:site-specific integrase [Alkalihalophilus lindianensis]|uniref:Site-specific integrase n=1 Tax=Alkalihalophilus lindianensis TaxID=1630542 RepID=A0ABU3X7Y2_9BACI|nr:site-specific integrase [Alkalihalophilus lindianensis]MDV2683997.1 site-specific integrase [Alkalihalophilus lindianensis]
MKPEIINDQRINSDELEIIENYVDEFLDYITVINSKRRVYIKDALMSFYLYVGKEFNDISESHCIDFFNYLTRVQNYKKASEITLKNKIDFIKQFISYLYQKDLINFQLQQKPNVKSIAIRKPRVKKGKVKLPIIVEEFITYLDHHNYQGIKYYKKRIMRFHRFLTSIGQDINIFLQDDKQTLLYEVINQYEKFLTTKVNNKEIKLATVTGYLRTIQLFLKYLHSKSKVSKKYVIPIQLRGRAKQANQYVPKEKIIQLMNTIYEQSNHVLRDLSIFLIIVDTGCRPIEVANLTIDDFKELERTLSLSCAKTERRKIKVSTEVAEVIVSYLSIRDKYHPKTENLFSNSDGSAISSEDINNVFYSHNLKAFGKSLYPAKAFRHTYITNALEEHPFEKVSKTIGHREWRSTFYYYQRSNKRLLSNTLNLSPLSRGEEKCP